MQGKVLGRDMQVSLQKNGQKLNVKSLEKFSKQKHNMVAAAALKYVVSLCLKSIKLCFSFCSARCIFREGLSALHRQEARVRGYNHPPQILE